ncbi:pilus assembly protein [Camelimonas fluminis]|uniref:CpaE family protein n=1 Tax=Camelimonas fluminis TaxID=1576911 RepID=A0ABV7UH03_9HYPH|nr:AAA family ATPase [Camelimonas fluminis]GHE73178.1 pilus assembly protein [Camelimonas fluminis]
MAHTWAVLGIFRDFAWRLNDLSDALLVLDQQPVRPMSDTRFITVPRITIDGWYLTPETKKAVEEVMRARQMVRLKSHSIEPGGIVEAIKHYVDAGAPDVLIVETRGGQDEILEQLVNLSKTTVVTSKVVSKVIVIGSVNDINFYRRLLTEGIAAYLVGPPTAEALLDSIVRIYDNENRKRGNIIAVIGASGGAGTSCLAQNVAWQLAEKHGQKTLLVDADLAFGSCGLNLDTTAEQDIGDALDADRVDAQFLSKIFAPITDNLDLLASPSTVGRLYATTPEKIEPIIDAIREASTLAVIDLPHQWNVWTNNILKTAKEVIVVTTPDLASLQNARNIIKQIALYRSDVTPPIYVINGVGMSRRQEVKPEAFVEAIGLEPAAIVPHESRLFSQAMNDGKPVAFIEDSSAPAKQFDEICKIVLASIGAGTETSRFQPSNATHEFTLLAKVRGSLQQSKNRTTTLDQSDTDRQEPRLGLLSRLLRRRKPALQ